MSESTLASRNALISSLMCSLGMLFNFQAFTIFPSSFALLVSKFESVIKQVANSDANLKKNAETCFVSYNMNIS